MKIVLFLLFNMIYSEEAKDVLSFNNYLHEFHLSTLYTKLKQMLCILLF